MKKKMLLISILTLASAMLLCVRNPAPLEGKATIKFQTTHKSSPLEVGKPAPDFTLQTVEGKRTKLSDYRGKKILLHFWATWCPSCKEELPVLQNIYDQHKKTELMILTINVTNMERGIPSVRSFAKENNLTFPIALDVNGTVGKQYHLFSIPTSYLIDEQGRVTERLIGPINQEMIRTKLNDEQ